MRRLILPVVLFATGTGVTDVELAAQRRAPPPADRFAAVRAVIARIMDSLDIPGVAVAVAQGGQVTWEQGFGWADRERMVKATEHTMFSLASISKPMTATGLMLLVERGLIDLDRPANDYLGAGKLTGIAGDAAGATIRRVMSHTAGLPLHYQFYYETETYREPAMDETIARYGILMNPPGDVYQYSNLGYGIIDHVIARASRRDYADFMRAEVFLPLGLTHTSVHIGPGLAGDVAQRYDSKQRPIPYYDFDHDGGSAIYSSAHDLVRFGMFHLKNRVPGQRRLLADSTIDRMHRIVTPGDTTNGYGLGWLVTVDDNGYGRVSHTGGMPGVATALSLYPAPNVAIVVLTNRSAGGAFRIGQEIAAAVLPGYGDTLRARRARGQGPQPPAFATPAELAGEWRGTVRTWEDTIPLTLVFQPDGDVHAKLGNQLTALVNGASWRDSFFVGRFAATIPTPDARRHAHTVLLNLRLRSGKLFGQASAQTTEEPVYFALTSYAELVRKE